MTALPKRKISHYRQGKRRAAIKIKTPGLIACPNCGQAKKSHQVCPHCGFYKKTSVIKAKK
ncbi:MAG: 50S ribosomal protein L32 [Candidatus Shapirobacteria bacterium]|nr:50S ribosomal protein L32 [Candidatus Shapirobacteria bacterium]